MAIKPLDDDTLGAIVDADRDSMSDVDLTLEARAHCAHSLRLGEALQQERAAHARTRAELAAVRERLERATGFHAGTLDGTEDGIPVQVRRLPLGSWVVLNCWGFHPEGLYEEFSTADAAFAALAAARKETT